MPKQHQIVAVVKARRERAKDVMTKAFHALQKPDLFSGLVRKYRPTREDEQPLPPEAKNLQASVRAIVDEVKTVWGESADTVLTQDVGNMKAVADVEVADGSDSLTLAGVPATHLLFLEKSLTDLKTMCEAMPTLDPSEQWVKDEATGMFKSIGQESIRTRKVQRPIVLYDATENHPAQTQLITEDISVGVWDTTKFSGAITQDQKRKIVRRIVALQEAVKQAREQANQIEVQQRKEGSDIMRFIFGD